VNIELLALFAAIALLVIVPIMVRERTKRVGLDLVARALERGQTLDPDLIVRLTDERLSVDRRRNNLARGLVLCALAMGCIGSAGVLRALDETPALQDFLVPAVLLVSLGAAFLLLAAMDRKRPNQP
jgi:hypothetical protein